MIRCTHASYDQFYAGEPHRPAAQLTPRISMVNPCLGSGASVNIAVPPSASVILNYTILISAMPEFISTNHLSAS